ncbi:PE domain-containing protein [Nocardia higoensis]|uniref:PE domain-containing protein n=1 Tax=Nocardia higoensis TaxID=228599 RepID=UPI0002DBA59A|nr:PE domain-containing protein [Nocardia higoensis]
MHFDPLETVRMAAELDELAARLEADLRTHDTALMVPAPGFDEVSGHAAATLRAVAADFDLSAHGGVLELRRLAATLRAQARELTGMDADNAAGLGAPA